MDTSRASGQSGFLSRLIWGTMHSSKQQCQSTMHSSNAMAHCTAVSGSVTEQCTSAAAVLEKIAQQYAAVSGHDPTMSHDVAKQLPSDSRRPRILQTSRLHSICTLCGYCACTCYILVVSENRSVSGSVARQLAHTPHDTTA